MKKFTQYLIYTFIFLCTVSTIQAQTNVCQSIAIPAYFYPGALWTQARNNAPKIKIMVMNPNSGSGTSSNPDYVTAVSQARAAGIKVVGYVYTSYGNRPAATVKQEITNYKTWYSVDGIFFDETATADTPVLLNYYQDLANFTRQTPNQKVIFNPGTFPAEAYMNIADIIATSEGKYKAYSILQNPAWINNYQPNRFWHIIYGANIWQTYRAIELAKQRNAGYIYITNDRFTNPYDTLPLYLTQILAKLPADCPAN